MYRVVISPILPDIFVKVDAQTRRRGDGGTKCCPRINNEGVVVASDWASRVFELLLGAELVGVSALALAAVGGTRGKTGIALAADHLVAVELGGKSLERGLDDATAQAEDKVKSRLLLDVVVGQSPAVLKLLASKDQALLVRGDALLVLDLGLDIVDGVGRLHLKGDGLAR